MKIALHYPFEENWFAEAELARRIEIAAQRLGWQAVTCRNAQEIQDFQPDCVLAMHDNAPKLTSFPTYGCIWSPPHFFEGVDKAIAHILSYDGYLVAAPYIERWLHRLLSNTPKPFLRMPFYTSSPATEYQQPQLDNPQLVYCGSNWDGQRFSDLFRELDQRPYMAVYGNPAGWQYLKNAYRGSLPFDGTSLFKTLHQAGVGLCLHRDEHRRAGVASMRIFEIVAAGAVAVCSDHPFIRDAFGDSVLYIDAEASPVEQARQIDQHMAWICGNREAAIALTQQAHAHFNDHYTLEKLLQNLPQLQQEVLPEKQFVAHGHLQIEEECPVQILLMGVGKSAEEVGRSLDSLSRQTYPNLSVTLIQSATDSERAEWHHTDVSMMRLEVPADVPFSTALWKGLSRIHSTYAGVLDAGDVLYPNHIGTLVQILEQNPEVGVAYSGAVGRSGDPLELYSFHPYSSERLLQLQPLVAPGSFLVRQSCLSWLGRDPELSEAAHTCLLLHLAQRTQFKFSYEVTVEVQPPAPISETEQIALRLVFWHQEFTPGLTIQYAQQNYRDLYDARARIAAMESSKFWKLRSGWFRVKRRLGIPTTD
ncbi:MULTISPECIES: hypothetical protein [unclassified Leptolyngbya]|uniref:glycosyltransferase family protein n=1 Tax=unclassified Leptolyngbya TaxID=2650499 RepID=UPI0016884F28|nr:MULTISPECIES: hypothetical protein [unclassified Leptolyngbya]MBD1912356.1 hypothetical protein [Leptolyngbya sp. FACHB-8]MBD2158008.1 hypothetical protein [Leptolyngbya sp. FACHB-16]